MLQTPGADTNWGVGGVKLEKDPHRLVEPDGGSAHTVVADVRNACFSVKSLSFSCRKDALNVNKKDGMKEMGAIIRKSSSRDLTSNIGETTGGFRGNTEPKDDQEIPVTVEEEEATGGETVDNVEFEEAIEEGDVEETRPCLHPGERVIQLQKLSDTRWACREKALKALLKEMSTVVKVLTDMTEQEPPNTPAGDAKMYLKATDFEFFLCLEIATPVFEVTALASDALQNCDIDLSTAYTVVDGVMDTLSNLRTEEQFGKLFKSATEKAEAAGISIPAVPPAQQRQRRVPAKYRQSTNAATESHSFQSVEDYYRGKVYYSFVDVLSQELKRRFRGDGETESSKILNALHTLTKANNWIGKDAMGPDSLDAL
ncbi:Zinc finger MYM-type protein 1 [Dissostichus eleginoides]|uniref:Zinc finger MYM-type protein 1 n=1 Tax=Dissostichus eleginoides TaxID=100907 RepID=A0AAD9BC25_DISEL|nr:Zinc finger MYM-type protein 1 [Dissostichus eleginoides]